MERKTIDDAPLSEKTLDDMIHDNYAADEYRTDSTKGFNLFNFNTKSEPVAQWKVKEFSSWFKHPSGLAVADSKPIIPYMNHKVVPNAPEKVDHNMFGNVIIKNQKDIPVDRMNRELPEKFAYGLDKKGMGDIAYETLDIEYGDENGLSRATANFYEEIYLKQAHPKVNETREHIDTLKKEVGTERGSGSKIQKIKDEERILVEQIPHLLGKTETPISDESSKILFEGLMRGDNKPLSVAEINRVNNILKKLNAKTIPYNTKAHNAAKKLDQAYAKNFENYKADQFHAKNKTKRQRAQAIAQAIAQTKAKPKTAEDIMSLSDEEAERKFQQRQARRQKQNQGAGGGSASESKRADPEYQDEGRPLPKKRDDKDEEDDGLDDMVKHMERKARFKTMAQRNQINKTSEQIRNSKEAVKQAAKDYQEQKQERLKKADELRDKSLNKYAKKIQTNYRAKKTKVAPQPPVPDKAPRRYTRTRSMSADSPNTFFKKLEAATPSTHRRLVRELDDNTDKVLEDNPPVVAALQEAIASKGKRITIPVLSSSGVDTSTLPVSVNQHPTIIANYESNIREIESILTDIGSGQITVQQKNIINKYLPDFVKSTKTKAGKVQEALNAMQEKLEDAKLLQQFTNLKVASPMKANPAFEVPKGTSAGGGGARK